MSTRWPVLEVRWQTLPDGGWVSARIVTPFVWQATAARWFNGEPPGGAVSFAERLWAVVRETLEGWV